jgi:hypothetical protein
MVHPILTEALAPAGVDLPVRRASRTSTELYLQGAIMAATRYDANAYLIVEANLKTVTHNLLNIDLVNWDTHYSAPYKSRAS